MEQLNNNPQSKKPQQFTNTRWSLVIAAQSEDSGQSEAALSELCQSYWFPLYGFIRRTGRSPEEAEDLTQGFFAQLLRLDTFSRADESKGKLRTFLLKALKDYIANEHQRENAQKRGGNVSHISLEVGWAEEQLRIEPVDPSGNPERQYERRWAMTLLKQSFSCLEEECHLKGKGELYSVMQPHLSHSADIGLKEAAEKLGMRDGAAKVALHRLRGRFKEIFREQIRETLAEGEDLEAEVLATMAALSV